MSSIARLIRRVHLEPLLPIIFAIYGALLLYAKDVPGWQWMFVAILACMSLVGLRDCMRSELIAWRCLTLTFAVIVFLVLDTGLRSGFMLWLYALALIYPLYISQISIVAVTTAIASGFALAEYWVIGLTVPLMHVPGVFIVGKCSRYLAHRLSRESHGDPGSIAVLHLSVDPADKSYGGQLATADMLHIWRDGVNDYLGEDIVTLTTASRELAVLLPDFSTTQAQAVAQTLRYRFSALALPPVIIELGTISSQPPSTVERAALHAVTG